MAIGIDFGKRHLAVAVSDLSHEVLAERWRTMHEDYDARDRRWTARPSSSSEALERSGADDDRVLGVGLGMPGPIHRSTGTVGSLGDPARLGGDPHRRGDERAPRPAVHVDNDANLGALAELHWGAGQGASTSSST